MYPLRQGLSGLRSWAADSRSASLQDSVLQCCAVDVCAKRIQREMGPRLLPAVCGSGAVYKRAVVGLFVMLTLVKFAPSSPPYRAGIRMLLSGAGI